MKKAIIIYLSIIAVFCLVGCKKKYDFYRSDVGIITNDFDYNELSDEEEHNIKVVYNNYVHSKNNESELTIEDITINYFFGKYNESYVVIIKGDSVGPKYRYYGVLCGEHVYSFAYIPEMISVIYNDKYYTLQEACFLGFLDENDIKKIYHEYGYAFLYYYYGY